MLSNLLLRRSCQSLFGKTACGTPRVHIQSCNISTSSVKFNDDSPDADVVTYEQLASMVAGGNVKLVDVRNPEEFQAGRIPGSINIPLRDLEQSLQLSPQHFELLFEALPPRKGDDNIVFHCQAGRRSTSALGIAKKLGYTRARHFAGGYSEWSKRGE
ncbi:thiosulfate:glutathione sulfurtransferase [Engraulis encrasicolus]|uniref:thiosulfate:glutathione sulfurtransferase n=1 Tax=Engraulis encrasicolus TaxID=184585 RepID=UPI002FD55F5C